jgi:PAS domain S-box-containing protein
MPAEATNMSRTPARIGLSSYLLRLTAVTVVPLIAFALAAGWLFARHERTTFERGAQERVRALSTAIDAELRGTITTLQAMAQSNALRAGDLDTFRAEALRIKADHPGWTTIFLSLPDSGQHVVNVLLPLGAELLHVHEWASFDTVVATRRPKIGEVVDGTVARGTFAAVRVPVVVDGQLRYVLSAAINPTLIQSLLVEQRLPSDWVGVIVDQQRNVVARTVELEGTVGKPASQSLREALASEREGFFHGSTLEGADVYTPFFTSAFSGWSVAMGIPVAAVEAGVRLALWQLLSGATLALLIGLGLAQWLRQRVARPISQLAAQAQGLAAGEGRASDKVVLLRPPVVEIAQLASALNQAVAAVQEREAAQGELATVTSNASLALFKLDLQGRCEYMNTAAEAMTGYTFAEVRGARIHDLVHRSRPDGTPYQFEQCPIMRALALDRRQQGEDVFVHKSGRCHPVAFTASPIRRDGQLTSLIVEVRDISGDKRVEAERAELLGREQLLRAEAEAANRGKDEFLAMLGHELRNPLGAIGNASYVARMAPGTEHAARAQEVIGRQIKHLTRLVDDLLDAGRVASGKIVLARAPLDLAEVVRRALAGLAADGRDARHRIDCALVPAWVDGDETRLEQVMNNLLTNALRYTPADGQIVVRLASEAGEARLEVRDDGIGIPADLLPRIFDLFVQGNRVLERSQGGLGIGLTLVRRLIELHGGKLEAASPGDGLGSTFTVRLPLIDAPSADGEAVPTAGSVSAHGQRRRVLVVEDHGDVRATMCDLLRLEGHEVHACAEGRAAIEAVATFRPEVAIIDIGLPGMSGYAVAERIRREPGGTAMLLIAPTGYGQPEDRSHSLAAGFDLHVTKPVDMAQLLATIARWPGAVSAGKAERDQGQAAS